MQGVKGALYFCTKSDGGRLVLKDIAHRKQNTLLQHTVFVFMVLLIRIPLPYTKDVPTKNYR
jgi:hypothetical protein